MSFAASPHGEMLQFLIREREHGGWEYRLGDVNNPFDLTFTQIYFMIVTTRITSEIIKKEIKDAQKDTGGHKNRGSGYTISSDSTPEERKRFIEMFGNKKDG